MNNLGKLHIADYQPTRMRVFNATRRILETIGIGRVDFDEEKLMQQAKESLGLDDFGSDSFRRNMRQWITTVKMRDCHPAGKRQSYRQILGNLQSRLGAEAWFKAVPAILERKITAPVIILGFARSGTTRLQRMLAADARLAHLKGWESVFPVPWKASVESRRRGEIDPRISAADKLLEDMNKHFAQVHPMGTMEAEEELSLLMKSFVPMFGFMDGNRRLYQNASEVDAYQDMLKLLQLVSWWRQEDPSKAWVLKAPIHMHYLDSLMQVIPDAKLIFIHRDPIKVASSQASLTWHYLAHETSRMDAKKVGKLILEDMQTQCRKVAAARDSIVPGNQQLDVLYADMNGDWCKVMQRIYDFIGIEFTDEAKASMTGWLEASNKERRGHSHRLEDFGLDARTVDQALMDYRQRFNIPYEGKRQE